MQCRQMRLITACAWAAPGTRRCPLGKEELVQTLILTLHIGVCVLLVILVLLQSGKEGMGVIFGGGNSSVFGSSGAGGILAKLTALMAVIFVITSLSYTIVTSDRPESESAILNVRIEDDGKNKTAPEKPGRESSPAGQPQSEKRDEKDSADSPEAKNSAQTPPAQTEIGKAGAVEAGGKD